MDRKLGVLLHELVNLNLSASTAIVIHGDHGWSLSEQGLWRKMSNYENAVRYLLTPHVNTAEYKAHTRCRLHVPGAGAFDHQSALAPDTSKGCRTGRVGRPGPNDLGTRRDIVPARRDV
jgi:hypothetical protein